MGRRRQQARAEERRAQKAIEDALADQSRGEYVADRTGAREKRWRTPMGAGVEILTITWRRDKILIDFVILVMVQVAGELTEEARADCCHGYCHMHPVDPAQPPRELMALHDVHDVQAALVVAEARIESYASTIRDMRRS